jgi:DNA mismatch repair protein MutL
MSIQMLPLDVVDHIAAGEVVERPAHLVKELIENALDAAATEIEIDFDQGGRRVSVKDNGQGIDRGELLLAVARHATSKIKKSADLWNLASYGFRGEALATIAAVSRFQILSRTPAQASAASLKVEFGKAQSPIDQGGDLGTSIIIDELFANLPARLKFLRSEAAETSQIKLIIRSLALTNPSVGFRIRQAGKLLTYWPGVKDYINRAEQVLELSNLFEGEGSDGEYRARVVLAPPQVVERTSRQIFIYVQGRTVQDRGLQAAVMEAYRSLLMHGEFPVAVVHLTCPPAEVDVNIHPSKSQVKFQNPSQAFRAVTRAARNLLEQAPWIERAVPVPGPVSSKPSNLSHDKSLEHSVSSAAWSAPRAAQPVQTDFLRSTQTSYTQPVGIKIEDSRQVPWQSLEVIGQTQNTYIVCQSEKGLVLVDQHAAHERIGYEKLMGAWRGGQIDVQQYLLPLALDLNVEEATALLSFKNELEKLGVHMQATTPTTLEITASAALLKEEALVRSLEKMARDICAHGGSFAFESAVGDLCATMACHSVVRAGQSLTREEMTTLLLQMDEFAHSSFCPHGRPVSIEMSWSQIERDFGRIV